MNPFIQKNKNVFVILGVVAVSGFVGKLAYDVNLSKVAKIRENIRIEQEKGAALERIVKTNEAVKKLNERGWSTVDFASVVDKVSDLAQRCDVKILNLSPGQRKEEPYVVRVSFTMSAEGHFRDLVRFLRAVESEPSLLRVSSIALARVAQSATPEASVPEGVLSISLAGEAYHFK
jgi:Tfp pilus assembly protein PilO